MGVMFEVLHFLSSSEMIFVVVGGAFLQCWLFRPVSLKTWREGVPAHTTSGRLDGASFHVGRDQLLDPRAQWTRSVPGGTRAACRFDV